MTLVGKLSNGWSLWGDPGTGRPYFRDPYGSIRQPLEVAQQANAECARRIFLDVARLNREQDAKSPQHRALAYVALQGAKTALEFSLKVCKRWDPGLVEAGR